MPHYKIASAQDDEPDFAEAKAESKVEEKPARQVKLGEFVLFHTPDPNGDDLVASVALVTKVYPGNQVNLTVFFVQNVQPITHKISLAQKPQTGYYTFKD